MEIFTGVYLESRLVRFEGNSIPYKSTKHHLRAVHEVEHNILKLGHEGLFIDQVKVNFSVCGYLDPFVTSNEIDLSPHVFKPVVFLPLAWLLSLFINAEEKNGA